MDIYDRLKQLTSEGQLYNVSDSYRPLNNGDHLRPKMLSPQRLASVSDSCTVSTSALSVRGPADDESFFGNEVETEFMAEASFAGDVDEHIKDPCAICFTNRNYSKEATHFCSECGLLGHFLCEQCLGFHKKFTAHKQVKSFIAAKYKKSGNLTDSQTELEIEKAKAERVTRQLSEKSTQIKDLTISLQAANVRLKVLQFKLQLCEDMK